MMGKFKKRFGKLLEGVESTSTEETKELFSLSGDKIMEALYSTETIDLSTVKPLLQKKLEPTFPEEPLLEPEKKTSIDSSELQDSYKSEIIDLKKVKVLEKEKKKSKTSKYFSEKVEQLCFDYGPKFTQTLPSFRLFEPITTLSLSSQALQGLVSHGKKNLKDLLETSKEDWLTYKGIGQGHVDEIYLLLEEYLGGFSNLYQSKTFDPVSFFRTCLGEGLTEPHYLLIENYSLSDLLPSHQIQTASLKHIQGGKREEMIEKGRFEFSNGKIKEHTYNQLRLLFEAYIYSWISSRGGVEKKRNIYEHLKSLSDNEKITERVLFFIKDLFFKGEDFLSYFLIPLEKDLYTTEAYLEEYYQKLVLQVKSYYYKRKLSYSIHNLCLYLYRESAKQWFCYPVGFVEKILQTSSHFSTYRKNDNQLWITLS